MHVYSNYIKKHFHRIGIQKNFLFSKYKNDQFIIWWAKQKVRVKTNKRKLKKIRKDFAKIRQVF